MRFSMVTSAEAERTSVLGVGLEGKVKKLLLRQLGYLKQNEAIAQCGMTRVTTVHRRRETVIKLVDVLLFNGLSQRCEVGFLIGL